MGAFAGFKDSPVQLKEVIEKCLDKAEAMGDVKTICLPPISCTTAGFASDQCSKIMIKTCVSWLDKNGTESKVKNILIVNENAVIHEQFKDELNRIYGDKDWDEAEKI
jgi:O-acetyl-ADP-ribose deacetylase (regulator of RNase III)